MHFVKYDPNIPNYNLICFFVASISQAHELINHDIGHLDSDSLVVTGVIGALLGSSMGIFINDRIGRLWCLRTTISLFFLGILLMANTSLISTFLIGKYLNSKTSNIRNCKFNYLTIVLTSRPIYFWNCIWYLMGITSFVLVWGIPTSDLGYFDKYWWSPILNGASDIHWYHGYIC